jgi:phage FluMu protein gp41
MQTRDRHGPQPSTLRELATLSQEELEAYLEAQEAVELPDREAVTVVDSRSGMALALTGSAGLLK